MITKESCPYCNGPLTLKEDNTEDDYCVYWCSLCERYVVLSYLPEEMKAWVDALFKKYEEMR